MTNDCQRQFPLQRGGTPTLLAERATQWSIGMVLDPTDTLSASVDAFHIDVKDVVGQRSEDFLMRAMSDPDSPYIVRDAVDRAYPALPGPVAYWIAPTQNFGRKVVEGIDVDVTARPPQTAFGRFVIRLNGTWLKTYKQLFDDGNFTNLAGKRGDLGSIPRWKHALTFDWTYGSWNATLIETYTHSYSENCSRRGPGNAGDITGCTTRTVGAYDLWDLSGGYLGFKDTTLRLGIKNLFNRPPPVSNQTTAIQIGYDPTYADPRGRTFYGSFRYAFH